MSATQTTNLGLNKPNRQDYVSVVTDINDNMDILDSKIGAVPSGETVEGQIGAKVPTTRKINNKALSSDVTIMGSDIPMNSLDNTKLDVAVGDLKSALSKQYNYYRKGALRPGVAWNLSPHSGRMTEFIPFLPNQTFVFKTSGSVANYTGAVIYIASEGAQSQIGSDSMVFGTTQTLTSPNGCGCICLSFNKSSGACAANDLDGITIELNYITANDIPGTKEADTTNRSIHALVASDCNLFSVDNIQIGKTWMNTDMSSRATEFIPCMPNTPYHIIIKGSMPSTKTYSFSCIQKDEVNDVVMVSGQDLTTGHTIITTNSNAYYLAICFNCNTAVESSDFENISVDVKPELTYSIANKTESVFTPCSFPVLFYSAISTGDNVAINVLLPFRMFFVNNVDRAYSYVQFYNDSKQYVEYTVPHVSFLVFDKSDNTIKVVTGSYKESQIPLLFNHGGEPHGILESYYLQNLTIANNNVKSCLFSSRQGDLDGCPENSLAGFARAKYRGFDIVRASLSFTSDGVGVLCHDETINSVARNADGTTISDTVYVAESTYDELLEYDFGVKMGSGYAGTKITTLEDFLKQCKQLGQIPQLELKHGVTNANLNTAIDIVEKLSLSGVVEWHSDPIEYLEYILTKHDFATIGLIRNSNGGQSWSLSTNDIDEAIALKNGKNKVRVVTAKATPIVGSVIRYASRNNIEIKVASEYFTFDNFDLLVNTYSEVECAGIRHPKMYMFAKHYRYAY